MPLVSWDSLLNLKTRHSCKVWLQLALADTCCFIHSFQLASCEQLVHFSLLSFSTAVCKATYQAATSCDATTATTLCLFIHSYCTCYMKYVAFKLTQILEHLVNHQSVKRPTPWSMRQSFIHNHREKRDVGLQQHDVHHQVQMIIKLSWGQSAVMWWPCI